MSSQWSFQEIDSADEFEIPSSPSSPLPRQLVSALHQDLKNDDSAGEISSITNTATSGHTMHTGGTSFLDLPLELRIMVYDLAIPNDYSWNFRMPGGPKTAVKGINLLQSCRQVRAEVSDRVWNRGLCIGFVTNSIDVRLATSSLNSSALAKIVSVDISIHISSNASLMWGPIDMEVLSSFKTLHFLDLSFLWGHHERPRPPEPSGIAPFFTGLVIQILTQVPQHVKYLDWNLTYFDKEDKCHSSKILEDIAARYKSLRGSAYKSQTDNS